MPASFGDALVGLILLALALIPTGLVILRGVEWAIGRKFSTTPVERAVLAFYAAGFLFFFLVSIPIAIYGTALVATTLFVGTALYAVVLIRERATGARAAVRLVGPRTGLLLCLGTLGLLAFELAPIWSRPFPNSWDGSVTALWTNLILRHGTSPTNLLPFSSAPVVYPLATATWMTLPTLILGWPVVEAPVLLPTLFLSLTVPAAFSWGARWSRTATASATTVGLLFAAFFGLVAGLPRFYTGGWYDFALAAPLLLVIIGFLPGWAGRPGRDWKGVLGVGLACGVLTSLSVASGEAALVLLLAYTIARFRGPCRDVLSRMSQVALIVLFELLFTVRSLIAWAGSTGASYAPAKLYGPLDYRLITGELDPFILWKAELSPVPAVSLCLQILLAVGLFLAVAGFLRSRGTTGLASGPSLSENLLTGTSAMFLLTAFLLLSDLSGQPWDLLRGVSNLEESSVVLFIFFEGLAVLPLVILVTSLADRTGSPPTKPPREYPETAPSRSSWVIRGVPFESSRSRAAVAIAIVVLVLGLGVVTTLTQGSGYIRSNVAKSSNVTPGDIAVLEWAGAHLPSCSVVLVGPGSAAQFLPEYATLTMVYPMNPVPSNGSYAIVVANLTEGVYSSATRSALLALGVTEVFITGQTSVTYPPLLAGPLESSSDFSLLFASGDAAIFGFLPILSTTSCAA